MYKTGLVIGKFCPFHKGHQYLIKYASALCSELTIIICHTEEYTIPISTRLDWIQKFIAENIQELSSKKVFIKVLTHAKEMDDDSTEKSKEWADLVSSFLGYKPDVVITSEDYGVVFAKELGAEHFFADRERRKFPVSGTAVRNNAQENWDFVEDDVKDYFVKRVVVVGAESTGTTTLAMNIAKKLKTVWVPEYGRFYYEGRMFLEDKTWNTGEFGHIMEQQNAMEIGFAKLASRYLICDTDSFATRVWHKRYVGDYAPQLERFSEKRKNTLYLVTSPNIPFVQDGTRDGENLRLWMHELFIENLIKTGRDYYIITSDTPEQRTIEAIKYIEDFYTK